MHKCKFTSLKSDKRTTYVYSCKVKQTLQADLEVQYATLMDNQSCLSSSLKSLWQCGHRYSPSFLRLTHFHTQSWLGLVNCQDSYTHFWPAREWGIWNGVSTEPVAAGLFWKRSRCQSGPRVLMRLLLTFTSNVGKNMGEHVFHHLTLPLMGHNRNNKNERDDGLKFNC